MVLRESITITRSFKLNRHFLVIVIKIIILTKIYLKLYSADINWDI